jgi:hypothetical protein
MKKYVLTLIVASFLMISANSQIIRGGINFANITKTNDGDIDDANMLTSFQVGLIGDWKLLPMLRLQPGIVFSGKGAKTEFGEPEDANYSRATTNPYYIEIPVNLVFKTPTGPVKFFIGAGPYLAIGVAGKLENKGKVLGISYENEEDIVWSDDDPTTLDYEEGAGLGIMRRFDYGANITGGIEFTKLVIGVNYGHGLAKLQSGSDSDADDDNKHRVFSVTLGIKLN